MVVSLKKYLYDENTGATKTDAWKAKVFESYSYALVSSCKLFVDKSYDANGLHKYVKCEESG